MKSVFDKIFEFDSAEIEHAAKETDTTITELFAVANGYYDRLDTRVDLVDWVGEKAEAMLEILEETREPSKAERLAAEAEYKADQMQDETWLETHAGSVHKPALLRMAVFI